MENATTPQQKATKAVINRLHLNVRDRRQGDRRSKAMTRMNFGMEVHTQWFDGHVKPVYEGRYKVKYAGDTRAVFRYWNGESWQFNRRKSAIVCIQPGASDMWRGLAAKAGVH